MAERPIEAPAARPSHQGVGALGEPAGLGAEPASAVASDRRVRNPEARTEIERLGEVARGDLDLVAPFAQRLDHRPHDQDVR